MREPYGITLFCDDIRHEINGKTTMVGVYSSNLVLPNNEPALLPSLFASVQIYIPHEYKFDEGKLMVSSLDGEEVTVVTELELPSPQADEGSPERYIVFRINVSLTPFAAKPGTRLQVRAYFEGNEFKLGTLSIVSAPSTE